MTYIPVSGGGGSLYPGYAPPSSPSAYDDELDSDLSAWSTWDAGSNFASPPSVAANFGAVFSVDDGGGAEAAGIYRTAPAGSFAIYALVNVGSDLNYANCHAGVFVGQDVSAAPTTAQALSAGLNTAGFSFNRTQRLTWTNYAAIANGTDGGSAGPLTRIWARIRHDSVGGYTYSDFSVDGKSWYCTNRYSLGWNPTVVGMLASNNTGTNPFVAFFRHFRLGTSALFSEPLPSADYE